MDLKKQLLMSGAALLLGGLQLSKGWAGGGAPFTAAPPSCSPKFYGQASFTQSSASYDLLGTCWDGGVAWTFYGKGAYTDGKPQGRGQESYTFSSSQGNGEMQLSMDCFGDPWIDEGLCNRQSMRIAWKGPGSIEGLMKIFSYDVTGPISPPFSATYLRRDRPLIQTYKSQRQAYLAKLEQDRLAQRTEQSKPVSGALEQTVNARYMPTILSPADHAQFTKGSTVMLMIRAPEADILGSFVQVEFHSCVYDQARNACNWTPRGTEARVSVPDLLAGSYRLPARIVNDAASWRLRVQRPADSAARIPAGYPSLWRNFSIVPVSAQQGPIRGPLLGR